MDYHANHLWARAALRASIGASALFAWLLVSLTLALCWGIVFFGGGADRIVPHLYYIPITLAAIRFGHFGALLAAVIAGLLAGPLTYVDVAAGTPQELSRWLTRMGFFIAMGQIVAFLVEPSLPSFREELKKLRLQHDIRRGLKAGEFFLRYQPIFSFSEHRRCGAEALVRWRHPRRGELAPVEFLPLAEQSDLICEIGQTVIEEACRQTADWRERLPEWKRENRYISINLSARELDQPKLARQVGAALRRHQLPPSVVQVEITESCLAQAGADSQLRRLKDLGVRVAIDDFGTGFSSLSYLSRFPVDVLKIDRSLTLELTDNRAAQALARGISRLAHSIGVSTVAEGIETPRQHEILEKMGIHCGQGYYFADPMLPEEFEQCP